MKKGLIVLLILLVNISFVLGANCGGDVQCQCWDTLAENQTMWYDMECEGGLALDIGANNVVLDCNGHIISGDSIDVPDIAGGIRISEGASNITLKNCNIRGFDNGVINWGSQANIERNNISEYGYAGVRISEEAQSTLVLDNVILNGSVGIRDYSGGNSVISNRVVGCEFGYYPEGGNQNLIQSNIFEGNTQGIALISGGSSYDISYNTFNNSN